MPQLATTVFAALRAAERVSPGLAARLAEPVFQSTQPPARVRPGDRAIHDTARRSVLRVRGREIRAYEWGRGADTVLLVHGWRGRGSQFATIVRELRSEGYRLVAFDAPASGDSPGRRTDIRDWLAAIEALQQRHGRFRSIIGHSFGSLAALTAVREGVATDGVVSIAGMGHARYLVDGFGALSGLRPETTEALAEWFAGRIMPGHPDPWGRFDAIADPLPAGVPLLAVHDRDDREVPVGESVRLHAAHGARSRLVLTSGAGHNAVLGADPTLDAVNAFVARGLAGVDATVLARRTVEEPVPAPAGDSVAQD
ncbi:alpha/beta fold hydrolase [Agromyces sp. MMS24-K17]|uniref:alpha/beta fold hydrolase n=1 Tax=Agromyces sp. MMS24-K17 TaxID=3372850 RepID=UPI0037549601